jgi:hypothetical protein
MQKRPPPKINLPQSDYYAADQISTYDNIDPDRSLSMKKSIKAEREGCAQKQPWRLT